MKNIILATIVWSLFFSCNSENKKEVAEEAKEKEAEQHEKQLRLATLTNLATKYSAIAAFDTLHLRFTYQYQNILSKNNKIILDRFLINDVIKQDSVYLLSIKKSSNPKFFVQLTCTDFQLQSLLKDTLKNKTRYFFDKTFLVIDISSIKKIKYKIDCSAYETEEPQEEPDTYLEIDESRTLMCNGRLIDIYESK